MPVDVYPDEGRVLIVECRARSHAPKVAAIATFQEQLDTAGTRVEIRLLNMRRTTSDGTVLIKHPQAHVEIGPGNAEVGLSMRDPHRHPITETLIYVDDDQPLESAKGDLARDIRFHHQLLCPLCGLNVSTRYEHLNLVLGRLIDGGVSRIDLARFAAIVDMH